MGPESHLRMPVADFMVLQDRIAPRKIADGTTAVYRVREIKSEAEIDKIRATCAIADAAFDRKRCVRPVVSVLRLFDHATLQLSFAGGSLWSTKLSTGWRFPVEGGCRGSRFWMGRRGDGVGRTM
jgi:predicted RecB family endonuclease